MTAPTFQCPLCGHTDFVLHQRDDALSLDITSDSYRIGLPSELVASCTDCEFCGVLLDISRSLAQLQDYRRGTSPDEVAVAAVDDPRRVDDPRPWDTRILSNNDLAYLSSPPDQPNEQTDWSGTGPGHHPEVLREMSVVVAARNAIQNAFVHGAPNDLADLENLVEILPPDLHVELWQSALDENREGLEMTEFQSGLMCGRLSTLAWVLGHSWDCGDAFLGVFE